MAVFLADVPYHIQAIFVLTFSIIWISAFSDDYLSPLPED